MTEIDNLLTHMKKYIFLLILASILTGLYFAKYSSEESDAISCTSNYRSHIGDEILKLSINYKMSDGNGYVTLNGGVYESGVLKSNINVGQEFSYTHFREDYLFKHIKEGAFELNSTNTSLLQRHLYDFYLNNASGPHKETISKIRPGVWVFTTYPIPYLICTG